MTGFIPEVDTQGVTIDSIQRTPKIVPAELPLLQMCTNAGGANDTAKCPSDSQKCSGDSRQHFQIVTRIMHFYLPHEKRTHSHSHQLHTTDV